MVSSSNHARSATERAFFRGSCKRERTYMRRVLIAILFAGAFIAGSPGVHAQGDGGYRLVPNWPKLPAGMYFGLKDAPPPPAERDAQAAARRARGGAAGGVGQNAGPNAGPTNQPGISGLAIDA